MSRPTATCPICQCSFGDSNCCHWDATSNSFEPILDDDEDNLLDCGPSGFGAFLPSWLLDPPACHVYSTLRQPIAYNAAQTVQYNSERYDTDSMHDNEKDFSRITFKTPGLYEVTFNVRFNKIDVDTGDAAAFIMKNGASFIGIESSPIGAADLYVGFSMSVQDTFESGDYVESLVKQDAVLDDLGLLNHIEVERSSPIFCATFIRPAI